MSISYIQYQTIVIAWMAIAVAVFLLLLRVTAPYGRHASRNWGPMIDNHTGWLLMELPALIVMGYVLVKNIFSIPAAASVMIGLYCLHYVNRSFIFPFRLHTKGKKMPLLITVSAIFFNLVNTFLLGYYFTHFADYQPGWLTGWKFITGFIIFLAGLYINWKADDILIHLRKPGETHYTIPRNWLFEWISCPNMFGEIIEWTGFAVLCWNLPALSFLVWSCANLIPRAIAHHKWYKDKFADYPPGRKAIIPFIA